MNKKQQDIKMFGSNNEIGYVAGNVVLVVVALVLSALVGWMIWR